MESVQTDASLVEGGMSMGTSSDNDQYLTFMLGGEEYGVDIQRVEEIKGWDRVTHIPNTPDYMRGVINLRGAIIPVVDLRQRFGMPVSAYGPTTVVIVLRVKAEDRERVMGVVVDAVSDVYDIPEADLKPPPANARTAIMESVLGLATVDEQMIILMDIDHLMNTGELSAMEAEPA